ncbi:MAG: MFS transporter [Acidimicrobiia bacterium]
MTSAAIESDPHWRRSALAVAALFFVNGMTFSNWLPRIPEVRDRLGMNNAGLGASLLGGGLGGLVGSLLVAQVQRRWGTKRTVLVAATSLAVSLPLIAATRSPVALTAVLTTLGLFDVMNDMAMNAQGVFVQRRLGCSIMNRLHGTWSLGFTLGALLGSLAVATHVPIVGHLVAVGAVMAATVVGVRSLLVAIDDPVAPMHATVPHGPSPSVIAMAFMAGGAACFEGAPNDWSAVLLRDAFEAGRWSGAATVVFAGAMLVGRMSGDHLLDRVGRQRLLTLALSVSGTGALIVVLAPGLFVGLIGFAVWGLGISVVFPQIYATAASLNGVSSGAGLGAMGVGQRLGFLIGPLGIGVLAQVQGLQFALTFAVVASLSVILVARWWIARRAPS